MRIHRHSFSFLFLFVLFAVSLANGFRRSSEEKLTSFIALKNSPLPIVSVTTDGQKPVKSKENYRRADAYFFEDFNEALAAYENPDDSTAERLRSKIRGRGNSTWRSLDTSKRSYLLKLDEERELFGLPSARKWILQGNVTDKTSLRNAYAYHLGRKVFDKAGWSPDTRFVNFFLNGKFLGLYLLMEKAEISPNRINLPLDEDDESFLAEVNSRLNREWNFISGKGVKFSIREKGGAKNAYYQNAEKTLKDFEEVLFGGDFADSAAGYRAFIDFDSFADWYIVNEFTKNHDAQFQDSCFLFYSSRDRKIHMGPIWDFDISCGNNKGECAESAGLFIQNRLWFKRLWEDEYFRQKVAERWRECRAKIEESFAWIEEQADFLEDDANLDDKIWQRFGYRQWPNSLGYKKRKTYRTEVAYMTDWLKARADWLDSQWK